MGVQKPMKGVKSVMPGFTILAQVYRLSCVKMVQGIVVDVASSAVVNREGEDFLMITASESRLFCSLYPI